MWRGLPAHLGVDIPVRTPREAEAQDGYFVPFGPPDVLRLLTQAGRWLSVDDGGERPQELGVPTLGNIRDPGSPDIDADDLAAPLLRVQFSSSQETLARAVLLLALTWDPKIKTGALLVPAHMLSLRAAISPGRIFQVRLPSRIGSAATGSGSTRPSSSLAGGGTRPGSSLAGGTRPSSGPGGGTRIGSAAARDSSSPSSTGRLGSAAAAGSSSRVGSALTPGGRARAVRFELDEEDMRDSPDEVRRSLSSE